MKKGLLLGAGFSFDLGMPLASELTDIFLGMFRREKEKHITSLLSRQSPFSTDRPINQKAIAAGINLLLKYKEENCLNYEKAIGALQKMEGISDVTQSDRDSYHFIFCKAYEIIHSILVDFQQQSYIQLYGHNRDFFQSLKYYLTDSETWVFSLNHDLYVEALALDMKIPITYGETGKLSFPIDNYNLKNQITFGTTTRDEFGSEKASYFRGTQGLNLVKLHGGISELHYKDKSIICNLELKGIGSGRFMLDFSRQSKMCFYAPGGKIPSGMDRWVSDIKGELDILCLSMLTGENKASRVSKPKEGEEKFKLLDDVLSGLDELTVIGYSFGDEHINFRLTNAMIRNPKLKMKIIDPVFAQYHSCISQFDYDGRLHRTVADAANGMHYAMNQSWRPEIAKAIKQNREIREKIKETVRKKFQL